MRGGHPTGKSLVMCGYKNKAVHHLLEQRDTHIYIKRLYIPQSCSIQYRDPPKEQYSVIPEKVNTEKCHFFFASRDGHVYRNIKLGDAGDV